MPFFVPTASEGKTIVLEDNAETKIISMDEQKHYAEDVRKSSEEIRFIASGIKIIDQILN